MRSRRRLRGKCWRRWGDHRPDPRLARYVPLNPVRARMVERAEDYASSSVRAGLRGSRRKPGGHSCRKSAGQSRAIRAERVTSSFVYLVNCHRIPKSTPDFFGYTGQNMRPLDITTEASRAGHLNRSYGPYTDYVIHPGLPPNLVFPK